MNPIIGQAIILVICLYFSFITLHSFCADMKYGTGKWNGHGWMFLTSVLWAIFYYLAKK